MPIKKLRKNAGLTQGELAEKLEYYSNAIVCMWEKGKRTPSTRILPKLAEVLGCSIDDLFKVETTDGKENK